MSFFQETQVNIEGNSKLRKPQIEAYIKIKDYFLHNPQGEALVVLPTGTGKSGLISIAPFGVANGRVLIITPGLVTKDSISKTQESIRDNFWINFDIVFSSEHIPTLCEYDNEIRDDDLKDSHIIYSNIQKIISSKGLIGRVPENFFDMIIIDESHHATADSWQKILKYFDKAKKLHITGTPFRGDGQAVPGTLIHETSLSEVMRDKYVKYLRKESLNANDLYFTIAEEPNRKLTVQEVLQYKDIEWLNKSVALSQECSMQVISYSIEQLKELKKLSPNIPHKILAVGCSIKHAIDLKAWYESLGKKTILVHSEMDSEEKTTAFQQIENHLCEVVVSVNMLMEGYDHRYLTILSIFRPYKSLNAFAQVVGRVLRTIPDDEITDFSIDNNALIIYHEETGLDDLWKDFQKEVNRAKVERIKDYSEREFSAIYERKAEELADIESGEFFINQTDSFLDDIDFNELFNQKKKEISSFVEIKIDSIRDNSNLSAKDLDIIRQALIENETKSASKIIDEKLKAKRPRALQKELKELLHKKILDESANILADFGYNPKGVELSYSFHKIHHKIDSGKTANDACLVMFIQAKIFNLYGQRNSMTNDDLQKTLNTHLPNIINELRRMIPIK